MDIEQFRKAGYQAIDRICDYYYSLQDLPVISKVEPGYLKQHVPLTAPEEGEDFQVIADDYQKFILPGLTHWQHPSFFGYFPTACTFEGIIADLYATSTCNPGFNWTSSPACTELEALVMDWACRLLGLSPEFLNSSGIGGGALQNTASDSALIAVVAARSRYQRDYPEVKMEDLVIYTTTQTHSLGLKAGLVLGLSVRVLQVKLEDQFSLRGETLRDAMEEDEKLGKKPFILIATVGTTSSGAIDNLPEIQQIVKNIPSLWIHIDAAWAGVALSCPEHRERCHLNTINEFATSFCTNFHKWGLVNFDASTLWVRDRKHLTDALDVTPPFLRTKHGDAGTVIDYRNWHLALGRRFRSLKLWFVLRSFGAEGFRSYIRKTISLNQEFADFVIASDELSLVTPPSLALTVFRLDPKPKSSDQSSLSLESLNNLNRLFYGRISARNDILLTQTVLNGVYCIRLAVGAARTETSHIQQACELLHKEAELSLEAWEQATLEEAK
ncbi:pyridoxal phosphate-dependent transferase [Lyophyllum atratum]|nr:pyridoxal phosphate-dependent transferase [Lyophyllum atratum]